MNKKHCLTYRVIAKTLLLGLFLQSCGIHLDTSLLQLEDNSKQSKQCSTDLRAIYQLDNQKLTAEGGYLVTFRARDGKLQANVSVERNQKVPNYKNLPVVIAPGANLVRLSQLASNVQQSHIKFQPNKTSQLNRICIFKGGILGGMMEGEASSPRTPRLTDIKELRKYFYKGYLEITSKNYQDLISLNKKYEIPFTNYGGGVFVKGWNDSDGYSELADLLLSFSRIQKFKINCVKKADLELSEVMIRAVQFYEDMTELDLTGCELADATLQDMLESIPYPEKVTLLQVGDMEFSPELAALIEERFVEAQFKTGGNVTPTSNSTRTLNSSRKTQASFPSPDLTAYGRSHLNRFLPVISEKDIVYGKQLGRGGMGIVYQAMCQGNPVAVKKLLRFSNEEIAAFHKEAIIMANLRHKNIVSFLGFCPEEPTLVMEYMSGGSLWDLLKSFEKNKDWDNSWKLRYQIALDVAEGMSYLHDTGIIHRALSSEDILLDANMQAKITDFGIAALKIENSTFGDWDESGKYRWMAPEIFHTYKNSEAGDVYSYGMVLWQLGARKQPFGKLNNLFGIFEHIKAGNREIISEDTPSQIRKVIDQCWLPEPPLKKDTDSQLRPTMKQVRYLLEAGLEEQEKAKEEELKRQAEIEHIIKNWPYGKEILSILRKAQDSLVLVLCDITDKKIEVLIRHPRFYQIHTLNLKNNQIGDSGVIKLAEALPNSQIHTLNLLGNQIGVSGVIKLAEALPNSQIHTLNLKNNQIGDSGVIKLSEALPNSQVHTLDLYDNQIGASGAIKLSEALPNSQIHTLDLGWNNIGNSGAIKLAETLPNSQIHTLNLLGNQIGASGTIKLSEALPNSQIHNLDLNVNHIGASGAIKLSEALPNSQIHTLNLRSNQIGASGAIKLSEALPNSKIHTLYLSNNQIGPLGTIKLSESLPNSQIHTLDLSNNQIGDSGAIKLSESLPKSQIHTLDLYNNQIGASGAIKLSEALPNSKIHTLYLSNNEIGASGAIKLSEALPNSQIHTLNLRSNQIGASGAIKLAKALPKSQIHTLDLYNNQIGASGAIKLAKVLPNSQIHTLKLENNQIGASGAIKLSEALPNTQIHTLDLRNNQIGAEIQEILKLKNSKIEFIF